MVNVYIIENKYDDTELKQMILDLTDEIKGLKRGSNIPELNKNLIESAIKGLDGEGL